MVDELTGIHEELDEYIHNLGFFGIHLGLRGFIPGNGGDISILLSEDVVFRCRKKASFWKEIIYISIKKSSAVVEYDRFHFIILYTK